MNCRLTLKLYAQCTTKLALQVPQNIQREIENCMEMAHEPIRNMLFYKFSEDNDPYCTVINFCWPNYKEF